MNIITSWFGGDEEKVEEVEQLRQVTIPEVAEYVQRRYFRDFKTQQIEDILASNVNETVLATLSDISSEQKRLERQLNQYEDQKENWRQYYAKLFHLHKSFIDGLVTEKELKTRLFTIIDNESKIMAKYLWGTVRINKELADIGKDRKDELDALKSSLEEILRGREDGEVVKKRVLGEEAGSAEDLLNKELAVAYSREQRYQKLYKRMTKKMRALLQRKYEAMEKFDDNSGTIISLQDDLKEADNFLIVHKRRGQFLTDLPVPITANDLIARREFDNSEDKEAAAVAQRNILFEALEQSLSNIVIYEEPDIQDEDNLAYVLKQGITMYNNLHVVPWPNKALTPKNVYDIFMSLRLQIDSIMDQSILTSKLFSFYMLAAHYEDSFNPILANQARELFTYEFLIREVSTFLREWVFDMKYTELESLYNKAKFRDYRATQEYTDGLVYYFVNHMDEHINEIISVLEKQQKFRISARERGVAFTEQPILDVKLKF